MLTLDQVKSKSTKRLEGLLPVVHSAAIKLIERSHARNVPIIITQGLRTIEYQNELFAQGRTKPGPIVTNAKGGQSFHNYGVAIDFALLLPDGRSCSWDMTRDGNGNKLKDWMEVVDEAKKLGFEWGGDWSHFRDYPHLQMTFGFTINDYAAGKRPTAPVKEDEEDMEPIKVEVNGKDVTGGVLTKDGVTLVPLRAVGEALGAKVEWDGKSKMARVETER